MLRVRLVAVGRLKSGPERTLFDRYWDRAAASGRGLGFAFTADELDESRARRPLDRAGEEATAISRVLAPDCLLVALDEGGSAMGSRAFADMLGAARDGGTGELALAIGGPDGLGASVLNAARRTISFGAMTWPHQLVRVMAAEQLYRAITILAGHPYHRP